MISTSPQMVPMPFYLTNMRKCRYFFPVHSEKRWDGFVTCFLFILETILCDKEIQEARLEENMPGI